MKCPNCNADNNHNNKVCSKCGAQISSTPHETYGAVRCPDCGSPDFERVEYYEGKPLDPNQRRGLFSGIREKDIEIVRICPKCGKHF